MASDERPRERRSRARRVLGVMGAVVGVSVTFAVAASAAVVVHLDAPVVRRLVATRVSQVLNGELAGNFVIERIGGLGLRGVDGVRFRVNDPAGARVLFVDGAQVRLRALAAARSAIFGKGDIVVRLDGIDVDHADVVLDADAAGDLRLANAFAAKIATPPKPESASSRGVRIEAPKVRLGHAWIHGQPGGAPCVDADLAQLAGGLLVEPNQTRLDLERVDLSARGLPRRVDPRGTLTAHVVLPSKGLTTVDADFDGSVAAIPTLAHARMNGARLDAVVDGRDAAGTGLRATFGELDVAEEVTLHAEAHGELPKIKGSAHVGVGRGTVDVDANVDTTDGTNADVTLAVRHVDVHAIVPSAPESDIGLDAHARVDVPKAGEPSGDLTLETLPGKIGGQALPILEVRGERKNAVAHARGWIRDPRATADFEIAADTSGKHTIVDANLRAKVSDLSRLPILGAKSKGHGALEARGKADLEAKTIDAHAQVTGGAVAYGAQHVDDVRIVADAKGALAHPNVDVGIHAAGLASGEQHVAVLDLRARVEPGAVTTVRDARIDVVRAGLPLSVSASQVRIGGAKLAVEGAVIEGLGEPVRGTVVRSPGELFVEVDAPSIDLARAARLAGKPNAVRSGTLSMKGDVALRRHNASGELHAKVTSLSASSIEQGTVSLDATVVRDVIGVDLEAQLADAGSFHVVTSNLVLGGSPGDFEAWKRVKGRAKFDGSVSMAKIASLVPKESMPFSELGGRLTVVGTLRRDSADVPPEVSIHAHTRGLVVAGPAPLEAPHDEVRPTNVSSVQPWRSEGLDVSVDAKADATSGFGEMAFHVTDKEGTVIAFDAKSDLPYQDLVRDPRAAASLLEGTPVRVKVVVPKRALTNMPTLLGLKNMPGTFEAELDVSGTARQPRIDLVAHARGVRTAAMSANAANDADVALGYEGEHAVLDAKVSSGGRSVLQIGSQVDVRTQDLLANRSGQAVPWRGSAEMKVTSFPLEMVSALGGPRLRGRMSGEVALEDLHEAAKLHGQLAFDGLRIGRATYKTGNVMIDARDGMVVANARLEQTDGYADLRAKAGLAWGTAVAPTFDPNKEVEAHLDAKAFRAAAILPFVRGQLDELDGRIDANVSAKIGNGQSNPNVEGNVVYREGTLQLTALGEELKDARARVTLAPGGVIKVDDVYARGTEGELTADAMVHLRGLAFDTASANLRIPKRKPLDLAMQGQPLGDVSGTFKLAATAADDGKTIKVKVDVPVLDVALPQKRKTGIQELTEKEKIRVGVFRDPGHFIRLPLDKEDLEPPEAAEPAKTVLDIDVALGEVTVVQGNMARIVLGGAPHIRVNEKTEVTGQIQVKRGKVDVQGKTFEIERGTITFQPDDASNPIIVATAGWAAEDGSKIYADFVGPVKTGKVTLRSDPPRPRNEILAVILFGTADGANAGPAPPGRGTDGTTKAATGIGGGFAAQGLTEAMDDLTGVQATARIDTSRANNPAPEIEVQLARRLSVEFQHVLGTPPISQPDTNLVMFEWRFRRNWSLETTFGDKGKLQTDAIWEKRY